MKQSLEKIKVKRSYKKEDVFKKYKLSSKSVSSDVEFVDDSVERNKVKDKDIDLDNDEQPIFINKVFFNKIKIEYIDKKALRYLGPIFISSVILGVIVGIIFNF